MEFDAIATIIAVTMTSNSIALKNKMPRNTASPLLPVGDNARRQFHTRALAPYAVAGLGSLDIFMFKVQSSRFKVQSSGFSTLNFEP
jgi:hypothetical protein